MKKSTKIIIPIAVAVIIIAAIICVLSIPKSGETTSVTAMLSTAQKYLIDLDYEQAIAEFEKIIELEPRNVDAYLGLAEAYEKSGDIDKAIEILQQGYELTADERIAAALEVLLGQGEDADVTEVIATASISETDSKREETIKIPYPTNVTLHNADGTIENDDYLIYNYRMLYNDFEITNDAILIMKGYVNSMLHEYTWSGSFGCGIVSYYNNNKIISLDQKNYLLESERSYSDDYGSYLHKYNDYGDCIYYKAEYSDGYSVDTERFFSYEYNSNGNITSFSATIYYSNNTDTTVLNGNFQYENGKLIEASTTENDDWHTSIKNDSYRYNSSGQLSEISYYRKNSYPYNSYSDKGV